MAFDVDGARRVVGRILDDKLEIWRDSGDRTDDHLDEETGQLVRPAADEVLIWNGLGAVMPLGRPAITTPLDGSIVQQPPTTDYQAVLPVDTPELRSDDVLRNAGSVRKDGPRDPQLVGRRFRVSDANVGTYSVIRIVRVQVIG
ncbi:DUF6093 family protein [Streptomyces sp. NPDC020412]|uniref:DUF6093 family protein n=1 Tax=Streptomyces sp. NPDC020412 TaxID=3365073 RepID=UPI0037886307